MNHFSRQFLIVLILLTNTVPLPWGHTHAHLTAEDRSQHLRRAHFGSEDAAQPQGWHWHLILPGLSTIDSPAGQLLYKTDQASLPELNCTDHVSLADLKKSLALPFSRSLDRIPSEQALFLQPVYLRHRVLLL